MGILRDLIDVLPTWKQHVDKVGNKIKDKDYSSIATRAKEGVLQFQVIASDSIDIDVLSMISRALERQYTSFVQIVYSMNSVANINDHQGLEDYLHQFHQNTIAEGYIDENFSNITVDAIVCNGSSNKIIHENKEFLRDVLESFREDKLNDKFIPYSPALEAKTVKSTTTSNYDIRPNGSRTLRNIQKKTEVTKTSQDSENTITLPSKILTDNDVKKANELIPTTLTLRINYQDNAGRIVGTQDFLIGVKTILHPVSSSEIVANLSTVSKGKIFNFIRCTTGELSFVKDFLFAIDESKTDVVNRSNGSSGWWIALKNRRTLAKLKKNLFIGKNNLLPNATIVVSKEEADYIRTSTGIDIMDKSFVGTIMDKYFLLGFVVVDKSLQVAHFIFDGDREFQTLSFSMLERENSNKGNEFKEMLKLINRY